MGRWGVLAGLVLGRVAFGLQFQSVAATGPDLVRRFGLDFAGLGSLVGLYMAAGIVLSVPSGVLGRWLGERWVVGVGLAAMALGGVVTATAADLDGIGHGRVVAGAGAVALVVMQGKVVADRFLGRAFMPAIGLVMAGFPVGIGIASVLAGRFGWTGLAWAGIVPAALGAVVFVASAERPGGSGRPTLSWPTRRECALVLIAGLVWTLYNGAYYGYLAYLPSWMAVHGHSTALTAAVMTVATWLNLPAMLAGGAWAGRSGLGVVFGLGTLCLVGGLVGPALFDWPVVWGLVLGSLGAMHAGTIVALGTLSARPQNQSVGMGMFYTLYYMGGAFLPGVCGRAADWMGEPTGALLAGAVFGGLCLPVYWLHRRLSRRPA